MSNISEYLILQIYTVESISLTMGNARRPGNMLVYKSFDGVIYTPWIYRVSLEVSCVLMYGTTHSTTPSNIDGAICYKYAKAEADAREEVVSLMQIANDTHQTNSTHYNTQNTCFIKVILYIYICVCVCVVYVCVDTHVIHARLCMYV